MDNPFDELPQRRPAGFLDGDQDYGIHQVQYPGHGRNRKYCLYVYTKQIDNPWQFP